MGVGSLFYALLITATIYKFTTNIKSSQRLDFKWYLPVTESLLFVIPGFMSCCTTKWDCPLPPWGALAGDLKRACDRDRSPLRLGCRECNLWPLVLGAPCCHGLGLGALRGSGHHPASGKFSPRGELFWFFAFMGHFFTESLTLFAHSRDRVSLLDKAAQIAATLSLCLLFPFLSSPPSLWTQNDFQETLNALLVHFCFFFILITKWLSFASSRNPHSSVNPAKSCVGPGTGCPSSLSPLGCRGCFSL